MRSVSGTGETQLLSLPGALLGRLWPAERVVLGTRLCKWLRLELIAHADNVVLAVPETEMMSWLSCSMNPEQILQSIEFFSASTIWLWWRRQGQASTNIILEALSSASESVIVRIGQLVLTSDDLGDEGARRLADVLYGMAGLRRLNLEDAGIGDDGLACLADGLRACEQLEYLELSNNHCGATSSLAAALPECLSLTHLSLASNSIDDSGATALAEAIPRCPSLRSIDVRRNGLGINGIQALTEVLYASNIRGVLMPQATDL